MVVKNDKNKWDFSVLKHVVLETDAKNRMFTRKGLREKFLEGRTDSPRICEICGKCTTYCFFSPRGTKTNMVVFECDDCRDRRHAKELKNFAIAMPERLTKSNESQRRRVSKEMNKNKET